MQKILNLPAQYLILALAGFVAVLSVVVPVILKLTKKKDGNFRTLFLGFGMLMMTKWIRMRPHKLKKCQRIQAS